MSSDTIFALSSGSLPSGVAIVRVSGPGVLKLLGAMINGEITPRSPMLRYLRNSANQILDHALVLYFPAPKSFTGEEVCEFHLHGGRAVVASVLREMETYIDFREAEAGEFTKRAFLNGRMDLTEAESLSDLIHAETEEQRKLALSGEEGRHRDLYNSWQKQLTKTRAWMEAEFDFSDEEDVSEDVNSTLWTNVNQLITEIQNHIDLFRCTEIIKNGFRVAIIGEPNSGKSSLINSLANRNVAIVSDEAGTTRDTIEVAMEISGHKVVLIDTAGIRDNAGKVEKIGIERAIAVANEANIVLELKDSSNVENQFIDIDSKAKKIYVLSKSDLTLDPPINSGSEILISTKTFAGLDKLQQAIVELIVSEFDGAHKHLMPIKDRHITLLNSCIQFLSKAYFGTALEPEIRCEYLRLASHSLEKITGQIDVEDLLDVIFSDFCIGK